MPIFNSMLRLLSFSCALLFLFWPGLVSAEEASLLPEPPIWVGGDSNYPPYEYLDKAGLPAGYNVELTRAVA